MGEMGLFGMCIPQKYGGQGLDYQSFIIAIEEIARVDSSQAGTLSVHIHWGLDLFTILVRRNKRKYLPDLCRGNYVWAFALTEPNAGSDSRNSSTKANLKMILGRLMVQRPLLPMAILQLPERSLQTVTVK